MACIYDPPPPRICPALVYMPRPPCIYAPSHGTVFTVYTENSRVRPPRGTTLGGNIQPCAPSTRHSLAPATEPTTPRPGRLLRIAAERNSEPRNGRAAEKSAELRRSPAENAVCHMTCIRPSFLARGGALEIASCAVESAPVHNQTSAAVW